jgi:4-amino-4-deoxy-L-arabinose transferase-like glycosyltransferase
MPAQSSRNLSLPSPDRGARTLFVVVSVVALVFRLVLLLSLRDSPTFLQPIVDAKTYDAAARSFIQSNRLSSDFFWQPFFYPFFLSVVYRIGGASILLAKTVQIVLGSVTCGFTALLGRRLLGWRAGLLSGVVLAFYAPLAFLETEFVGTVFEAFWAVALVWLFVCLSPRSRWFAYLLLGLCGGLAAITRPTFLPFFAVACVWQ